MRYFLVPAMVVALSTPGYAIAQSQPKPAMPPVGEVQQQKPAPSQTPEQQRGVEDYLSSTPGRAGKQEPSASANNDAKEKVNDPVFVNGALNVPGAAKDSQTVPAKYSQRNDAVDKTPILAMSTGLTDDQKRRILKTVNAANVPVEKIDVKVSSPLPSTVRMIDLPASVKSEVPNTKDLKFVRLEDRVLIVYAPNWLVVGEIKN